MPLNRGWAGVKGGAAPLDPGGGRAGAQRLCGLREAGPVSDRGLLPWACGPISPARAPQVACDCPGGGRGIRRLLLWVDSSPGSRRGFQGGCQWGGGRPMTRCPGGRRDENMTLGRATIRRAAGGW